MKNCWKTNPDERPSFEECFNHFNSLEFPQPNNQYPVLINSNSNKSSDNININIIDEI
jgi:hypothetical protein